MQFRFVYHQILSRIWCLSITKWIILIQNNPICTILNTVDQKALRTRLMNDLKIAALWDNFIHIILGLVDGTKLWWYVEENRAHSMVHCLLIILKLNHISYCYENDLKLVMCHGCIFLDLSENWFNFRLFSFNSLPNGVSCTEINLSTKQHSTDCFQPVFKHMFHAQWY